MGAQLSAAACVHKVVCDLMWKMCACRNASRVDVHVAHKPDHKLGFRGEAGNLVLVHNVLQVKLSPNKATCVMM